MGWGERFSPSAEAGGGTTGQRELAHLALDAVGVSPGNLAVRTVEACGIIDRLRPLAEVGELAEALFKAGALDGLQVGDLRYAELVARLCAKDGGS
jgi:hypothetical protein